MDKVWHKGFEPVINKNSKVLILGSFPSVKSREQGFYYGNKQNRFWKTLEATLNLPVPTDVEGRKKFLLDNNIALWDVIESACLEGSLDSKLTTKNSKPVDFDKLFEKYPNIELVVLNGRKAFSVFKKFNSGSKAEYTYLPSTSPANVRFDIDAWITALKTIL